MSIKKIIKTHVVFRPILWSVAFVGRHFPELLVRIRYFICFHKRLNLKNPQTLNEKILYMSLRTDTTLWTKLADKYHVREYVSACGLSDTLVPLLGYWKKASDIDFGKLPKQFVLKTVQGSGDIILVKDKSAIEVEEVRAQMDKAVRTRYGELEGGKHYMRIEPAIIAEALLVNDVESKQYSTSIIDYKIWCFNGKAHYIGVYSNRTQDNVEVMMYDREWHAHPEFAQPDAHFSIGNVIPIPANLNNLIAVAECLARPFPVVRVDLYSIDGKIYFGEMTFTSSGGLMTNFTDKFLYHAGSLIDVNYKG